MRSAEVSGVDIEPPLFYMLATAPFEKDQRVVARTIWGDEPGRTTSEPAEGWVRVMLDRGMVLTVSTTRLAHEQENDR